MPSKHGGAEAQDSAQFEAAAVRLGENVRELRAESGMSQERLASAVGCSVRHVQRLEAGEVNASLRLLVGVAEALGADLSDLFTPREE